MKMKKGMAMVLAGAALMSYAVGVWFA